MEMKINYILLALIGVIGLLLGGMIGYYFMPEKQVITQKVINAECIYPNAQLCKPTEIVKTVVIEKKCPVCSVPKSCNELRTLQRADAVDESKHVMNKTKISKQIYAGPGQNL